MTTKQLRHCSAHVNINEGMFCNSYELVSYSTPVALLGMFVVTKNRQSSSLIIIIG